MPRLTMLYQNTRDVCKQDRLMVLLSDLEQCREDDRAANSLMLQVAAAGVAALAIVFALSTSANDSLESVPWLFSAFAIGIITAAFSYLTSVGIKASLRYHHMRHLEEEIRKIASMDDAHFGWTEVSSPIITLNFSHVRTTWTLRHFVGLVGGILASLAACIMLVIFFFIGKSPSVWFLALVLIAPLILLFASNLGKASASKDMYDAARRIALERRNDEVREGESASLRLVRYLAYPRPKDALKVFFVFLGSLIGVVLSGEAYGGIELLSSATGSFLLAFFVFDFLGYQARYQLNDIRGYVEDARNPEQEKRERLPHIPGNDSFVLKVSAAVAVYRVLLALVVCWLNPLGAGVPLLVCLGATFLVAAVYEFARSTKRTPTLLLLVLVSLGYPLRIFAGAWVAFPGLFSGPLFEGGVLYGLLPIMIATSFFGITFVGITWLLEGCDHYRKYPNEEYHKRHVSELARRVQHYDSCEHPLENRQPMFASWNVAMALSIAFMCVPLIVFAPHARWGLLACAVLLLLLFMMVIPKPKPDCLYAIVCLLIMAGILVLLFAYLPQDGRSFGLWGLTALAAMGYLLIYTSFRNTNYKEMNESIDNIKKRMVEIWKRLLVLLLGEEAAAIVDGKKKGAGCLGRGDVSRPGVDLSRCVAEGAACKAVSEAGMIE